MARKRELKPRKQPRQARATATVAAILDATAEAIAEHGFERANVNEIAERAGVSIGSLYQYFPNKEALLVQLIEQHTRGAIDALEDVLARVAQAPLDAAVREVIGAMVDAHRGRLNRTLALELDDIGRLEELERAVDERAGRSVVAFLSARRSEIQVPDPELAAFLLIRLVDELTHAALRERPDAVENGTLTEELTHLTLGYLERVRGRS
ncbi:MAG: TetR/AcrR family transcriptional regulator [Polyangiaceae bacterium]|nr:TetR/AcrR family transcriptional regulator [Polyangiaceae bacterium]